MIGQRIEAPQRFSWGALFFGLLGTGMVLLAAAVGNVHWAIASVLLFLISFALRQTRQRAFAAEFTEKTLEVETPPSSIPYDQMEDLRPSGYSGTRSRRRSFPILIRHAEGAVRIPSGLNVASADVYDFLLGQISAGGTREVNPALADYLRRQMEVFGEERVWSYRARSFHGRVSSPQRTVSVCLAFFFAGLVWVLVGIAKTEYIGWLVGGTAVAILGGLFALLIWLQKSSMARGIKHWRQASLVISPAGLALVQGDIQGELRWEELRDVRMRRNSGRSFEWSSGPAGPAIVLSVEGAKIAIADLYDRPLSVIHKNILQYWR